MKNIYKLFFLSFFMVAVGCNPTTDPKEEHDITATINGEKWYFYDVTTTSTPEGDTRLNAKGYLWGDNEAAEPANLEIVFVGVKSLKDAGEGYTADFAPTNAGTSAYATLRFPQQNRVFDTKLDPATTGTFTVNKIENNTMSGTFDFNVKDQQGNILKVESAEFTDIDLAQ